MIRHLACIMDGNRRWAKKHDRHPEYGHAEGVEAVKRVIQFCLERQISYLSLYTFSLENVRRSESEKEYLFRLLADRLHAGVDEFIEHGIRVRFIGDWNFFPASIIDLCKQTEERTAAGIKLNLSFLICYGSQQEIISATRTLAADMQAGIIDEKAVTPEIFNRYLWTKDLPVPDLIIRTSGHKRLSNFLLFQAAYSELYFLDCLWPDITVDDLHTAVCQFTETQRNFGV